MNELPTVAGQELVDVLKEVGWVVARQTPKHVILVKTGTQLSISVPNRDPLAQGALRHLIAHAGIRQPSRLLYEN